MAQGRDHRPSPADDVEPLVRRHDGYRAVRPDVQLPAALSQHRRRRRHRRGAGQRRLGGDTGEIFRPSVLGRRDALGLHAGPVYRRALPISGERRAASARDRAPDPALLRQRIADGCLERVQEPLPHPANPGILRGDRRQHVVVQCRRQARRDRAHSLVPRASLSRRIGESRYRNRSTFARRTRFLHSLRAERSRASDRKNRQGRVGRGRPFRRLHKPRGNGKEDPPRRVRGAATRGSPPAT